MLRKKRLRKVIKTPKSDRVLKGLNIGFLAFFIILVIVPLLNLLAFAFSSGEYNSQVTFIPQGITLDNFAYILKQERFYTSFINSVIITAVVTILSNLFMALAAYPLSKPDLPFRKGILTFFIITMLFSAGIVPAFLLLKMLGLYGTIWAVIIISISNVFNLLLYKSFFEGLPKEIEEAAQMDGISNIQMFFKIVIPMSLPVFASCCFFTIVSTWNSYGGALMFIGESGAAESQQPLSYFIYWLLNVSSTDITDTWMLVNQTNVQSASIIISVIPILVIYPFVIKYIKSGITLGSVK